jgi:hypothetical protein
MKDRLILLAIIGLGGLFFVFEKKSHKSLINYRNCTNFVLK